MPNYFGDLFYNRADGNGWSETYPIVASDYAACLVVLNQLRVLRLATLVSDSWLAGARISDSDVKGDSFPTGFVFPTVGAFAVAPADHTYVPREVVLRVLFYSSTYTKRSNRWIRSIPASAFDSKGLYTAPPAYTGPLDTYLAYVAANVSIATRLKGVVTPPFYMFSPIAAGEFSPVQDERAIGRPFGLPRGRRMIA